MRPQRTLLIGDVAGFDAAKDLEFEKAAEIRDRLFAIKEKLFGVALPTET